MLTALLIAAFLRRRDLLYKAGLSLIAAIAVLIALPAHAQTSCKDVFNPARGAVQTSAKPVVAVAAPHASDSPATSRAEQTSSAATRAWFRGFRKPVDFDADVSGRIKDDFVAQLRRGETIDPLNLKTLNEKVAWVDANGVMQGTRGDLFQLTQRFRDLSPAQKRLLANTFKNLDFSKKITWTQADKLTAKLYLLTHFDPANYGVLQVFKTKWDDGVSDLIRYRVGLSAARYGLVRGLTEQGFLRTESSRDRFRKELRPWMMPIDIAWSGALSTLSFYVPFMGTRTPQLLLRSKDLPAELNQRFLDQGFDAIRVDVHARYGTSARVQNALVIAERTLAVAFIPIMAAFFFEDIKFLGKKAYQKLVPNDPLNLIDEAGDEVKAAAAALKLPPQERKALVDQLYAQERQTRIAARDPYPLAEAAWEKEDRIAAVDEELRLTNQRDYLQKLPDNQLVGLARGESVSELEAQ